MTLSGPKERDFRSAMPTSGLRGVRPANRVARTRPVIRPLLLHLPYNCSCIKKFAVSFFPSFLFFLFFGGSLMRGHWRFAA